jgi:hypothetical protein
MGVIQTLTIKKVLPDLNVEINEAKKHWYLYSRTKKRTTDYIAALCKVQRIKPYAEGRLFLHCLWTPKDNRKDYDNICFAKKYVADGLVTAKVIPNDNPKYIAGFVDCFTPPSREAPQVVVTLIPEQEIDVLWNRKYWPPAALR